MSAKDLLAAPMHQAGIFGLLSRSKRPQLVVFGYHRLRPDAGAPGLGLDDEVLGPTAFEFRRQVRWLRQNTNLLTEAALLDILDGGGLPRGLSTMITFDDGYRDNYELALPILEAEGAAAIFFIPSALLDERRLGWWDLIAYVIKRTAHPSFSFDGERVELGGDRSTVIHRFHEMMKLRPAAETADLVDKLSQACEVPLPDAAEQDSQLMSWEEVHECTDRGITIGSHSHTHRVLATLDAQGQQEEMERSKAMLESKTGREVRTIAYPCGGYQHINADTGRIAAESGYHAGFSFNTGFHRTTPEERFRIRRLSAADQLARNAAIATLPSIFGWRTG